MRKVMLTALLAVPPSAFLLPEITVAQTAPTSTVPFRAKPPPPGAPDAAAILQLNTRAEAEARSFRLTQKPGELVYTHPNLGELARMQVAVAAASCVRLTLGTFRCDYDRIITAMPPQVGSGPGADMARLGYENMRARNVLTRRDRLSFAFTRTGAGWTSPQMAEFVRQDVLAGRDRSARRDAELQGRQLDEQLQRRQERYGERWKDTLPK